MMQVLGQLIPRLARTPAASAGYSHSTLQPAPGINSPFLQTLSLPFSARFHLLCRPFARLNLALDPFFQFFLRFFEIVVVLQAQPELRACSQMASQT